MFNLDTRRLYLCVGLRDDMDDFLPSALRGGVDVVQLREKKRGPRDQLDQARRMAQMCAEFAVPFVVNDSPELALEVRADGVHVGQDDVSVAYCRALLGAGTLIGLSTHSPSEFDAALDTDASYFSAGPIVATPTKPGREGTGLRYALESESRSDRPVYVTGGVTSTNVAALVKAGLRHFVVVRALTDSPRPESAARALREAIDEALSDVDRANPAASPPSSDQHVTDAQPPG